MNAEWHLLQLADSAFPTGGFAHSSGLEAAWQQGEIRDGADVERFLREVLWQAGRAALPLANEAYDHPEELGRLDGLCDVFLSNHVANRASRVMGRTFFATCRRSLALPERGSDLPGEFGRLGDRIQREELFQHHAPLYGAVMRVLGVERETMQRLYLHGALRSVISAAIRLGVVGPYQAQSVQWEFASELDRILAHCSGLKAEDLAQTAPLLEQFQANHDRLYSRLFQS